MSQKKASTKIDYDVLEDLFDDEAGEDAMAGAATAARGRGA